MLREIGSSRKPDAEEITLKGSQEEIEALRAMLRGMLWLTVRDADGDAVPQLLQQPATHPLPEPWDDPLIPPNWDIPKLPPVGKCTVADLDRFQRDLDTRPRPAPNVLQLDQVEGWHTPSFWIEHLCGHPFSKVKYHQTARQLTELGFECMRSRRGKDGSFWEAWYLPYLTAAKGELATIVKRGKIVEGLGGEKEDWRSETNAVVNWLCRNVSFGSLDVRVQRLAAMVID